MLPGKVYSPLVLSDCVLERRGREVGGDGMGVSMVGVPDEKMGVVAGDETRELYAECVEGESGKSR